MDNAAFPTFHTIKCYNRSIGWNGDITGYSTLDGRRRRRNPQDSISQGNLRRQYSSVNSFTVKFILIVYLAFDKEQTFMFPNNIILKGKK